MSWLLRNDRKNAKSFGWIIVTTHRREGVFQALLTADDLTVDTVLSKFHQPISEGDSLSGQYVTWSFVVPSLCGDSLSGQYITWSFVFPSLCRDFVSGHYVTWFFVFRLKFVCLVFCFIPSGVSLNSYLDSWDWIIAKLCHRPGIFEAESLLLTLWSFNRFLCCHGILHNTMTHLQSTKTPP